MRGTWVGYPVQKNVWRLPEDELKDIVTDIVQKDARPKPPPPRDFQEWMFAKFGRALSESFLLPYNAKVWAHPAVEMNHIWVGERVAEEKGRVVLSNVINRRDAPKWGPNAQFRYPMNGTGQIWVKVFESLPKAHKRLGARVSAVRTREGHKVLELADGRTVPYDGLLSTMPVVSLLRMLPDHPELAKLAEGDNGAADHSKFKHQTVNLVGIGVWGVAVPSALDGVHWVYFPEDDYVFYRVTVLSNFSPLIVAKPYKQWSLLIEVSESKHRHYYDAVHGKHWKLADLAKDQEALIATVKDGLMRSGMLPRGAKVASVWSKRLEYGYPVPYVERNMHVHAADKALRAHGIWSRGRFGSWKYEVGNQDHSCMLGVDAIDNMLFGGNEVKGEIRREATFNSPDLVNNMYRPYDFAFDAARLSADAGRQHTFKRPPHRLKKRRQWDWVLPHCDEKDAWLDRVRALMVALPVETKWLIHGYETCGVAEVKRPMLEMLREGLNHHDRIPHKAHAPPLSAWVKHIVTKYETLPELLFFAPASVEPSSSLFSPSAVVDATKGSDFAVFGSHVVEMPASMHTSFCAKLWPHTAKARKRSCPERVVTMANAVMLASRQRIRAVPLATWQALLELASESPESAQLLFYGWHLFFGEAAVLARRSITRH